MTIRQIYERSFIMPNLEQHMFRVTAVAETVGKQFLTAALPAPALPFTQTDLDHVIDASLLHDLGNMAKFKLDYFPEFIEPEGLEHWQKLQDEFWAKYGKNAHVATLKMLAELGADERVVQLVDAVNFNRAKKNLDSHDYALKLCAYADMRVDPHGVVSVEERFKDGQTRYQPDGKTSPFIYAMNACIRKIEQQLFESIELRPEDITDQSISELMPKYPDRDLISVCSEVV